MAKDPFSDEAAAAFLTGSSTAAKWPEIGYAVEGTVLNWRMSQQTDYDTSELLFWDGKRRVIESLAADKSRPVMQLIMEIQGKPTGETWEGLRNTRKALPDDDGKRTLYVKAYLQSALAKALKDAGGKLEEGAFIRVERVADVPNQDKKRQAAHNYRAVWTPAAQNSEAASSFLSEAEEDNPFADTDAQSEEPPF